MRSWHVKRVPECVTPYGWMYYICSDLWYALWQQTNVSYKVKCERHRQVNGVVKTEQPHYKEEKNMVRRNYTRSSTIFTD